MSRDNELKSQKLPQQIDIIKEPKINLTNLNDNPEEQKQKDIFSSNKPSRVSENLKPPRQIEQDVEIDDDSPKQILEKGKSKGLLRSTPSDPKQLILSFIRKFPVAQQHYNSEFTKSELANRDNIILQRLALLLLIIAYTLYIFIELPSVESLIIFHSVLFIILCLFFLVIAFKSFTELLKETILAYVLLIGVILKIIFDWSWEENTSLTFSLSSAIIPIFFLCFEFAHIYMTLKLQIAIFLNCVSFILRVSVLNMNVKNSGYVKFALVVLITLISWVSVYLLREYRDHKFAVFHIKQEISHELKRCIALKRRFLPYLSYWRTRPIELCYISLRVYNFDEAYKHEGSQAYKIFDEVTTAIDEMFMNYSLHFREQYQGFYGIAMNKGNIRDSLKLALFIRDHIAPIIDKSKYLRFRIVLEQANYFFVQLGYLQPTVQAIGKFEEKYIPMDQQTHKQVYISENIHKGLQDIQASVNANYNFKFPKVRFQNLQTVFHQVEGVHTELPQVLQQANTAASLNTNIRTAIINSMDESQKIESIPNILFPEILNKMRKEIFIHQDGILLSALIIETLLQFIFTFVIEDQLKTSTVFHFFRFFILFFCLLYWCVLGHSYSSAFWKGYSISLCLFIVTISLLMAYYSTDIVQLNIQIIDAVFVFFIFGSLSFFGLLHVIVMIICDLISFFILYGLANAVTWDYVVFFVGCHILFLIRSYFSFKKNTEISEMQIQNNLRIYQITWFKVQQWPTHIISKIKKLAQTTPPSEIVRFEQHWFENYKETAFLFVQIPQNLIINLEATKMLQEFHRQVDLINVKRVAYSQKVSTSGGGFALLSYGQQIVAHGETQASIFLKEASLHIFNLAVEISNLGMFNQLQAKILIHTGEIIDGAFGINYKYNIFGKDTQVGTINLKDTQGKINVTDAAKKLFEQIENRQLIGKFALRKSLTASDGQNYEVYAVEPQ